MALKARKSGACNFAVRSWRYRLYRAILARRFRFVTRTGRLFSVTQHMQASASQDGTCGRRLPHCIAEGIVLGARRDHSRAVLQRKFVTSND